MCYMLLLATDASDDLATFSDELLSFECELPGVPAERLLTLPQRWFVAAPKSCSCDLRHLHVSSIELGFSEPVAWYPEEPEAIEATGRFIAVVRRLVERGAQVECVDAWYDTPLEAMVAEPVTVDLSQVRDAQFRLFENHRFVFVSGSGV